LQPPFNLTKIKLIKPTPPPIMILKKTLNPFPLPSPFNKSKEK
jgi:hypothetical protein